MSGVILALSIVLIVLSVILVAVILFQSNRSANMSGAVAGAGASNNFFGKNKSMTREMLMQRLTVVFSILFILIVLVLNIFEMM